MHSTFSGVLAASIDVIGIPKRVLTSPDLAAYVMAEGDDGDEGGRAEVRTPRESLFHASLVVFVGMLNFKYCGIAVLLPSLDVSRGGEENGREGSRGKEIVKMEAKTRLPAASFFLVIVSSGWSAGYGAPRRSVRPHIRQDIQGAPISFRAGSSLLLQLLLLLSLLLLNQTLTTGIERSQRGLMAVGRA